MSRSLRFIICVCLSGVLLSCSGGGTGGGTSYGGGAEYDRQELFARWSAYSYKGEYRRIIDEALPIYRSAAFDNGDSIKLWVGLYIAQSYVKLDTPDSVLYYLEDVLPIARRNSIDSAMTLIYNTYGLHSLDYNLNYNNAVDYFMTAMAHAEKLSSRSPYFVIVNNLSHTHTLRNDTAGLKYALEVYREGERSGDSFFRYIGALNGAAQYLLREDYEQALKFIEEAVTMADEYDAKTETYTVYADILVRLGRKKEADKYYALALKSVPGSEASAVSGFYKSYGSYLMDEGRYAEAAAVYENALRLSLDKRSYMYRHKLYKGLAEAYGKLGNTVGELRNFKMYHQLSDSIFNAEKERSLNEMWVKYETERREKELDEKELLLVKESRRKQIYALIILLLMTGAVAIFVLYRRKKAVYEQLVRRHQEYMLRERIYRDVFAPENAKHHAEIPLSEDEKHEELFRDIENIMRERKVYREKEITIDKLAEYLQSNRSYISYAINQYAGVSFKNYINGLRIADAVTILSDQESDVPVKVIVDELGFNNLTSFYRAFLKETGVPPSSYRRELRRLQHNPDSDLPEE